MFRWLCLECSKGRATLTVFVLQWEKIRNEERNREGNSEEWNEALEDDNVEVQVSEVDRDPYGIMIDKAEL